MSTRLAHTRLVAFSAAAGCLLAAFTAQAETYQSEGSFQTYGSGTGDAGWGWCLDREYNTSTARYDLYQEPCATPLNPESGWNPTATQGFRMESSGLIEAVSSNGTNLGCLDVYFNDVYAGAEIDIDPPGGQWGCVATNAAQVWGFKNGQIVLRENPSYCLQAPSGPGSTVTLQKCSTVYAQQFTPINISVQLWSGAGAGNSVLRFNGDNGDCQGNGPPLFTGLYDGGNDDVFLFEPYNEAYYHALLAGQQPGGGWNDPSPGTVGFPVYFQQCLGGPCEYSLNEYQPAGGGDGNHCTSNPLGNAFGAGFSPIVGYGFEYSSSKLVNAESLDVGGYGLPSCITANLSTGIPTGTDCQIAAPPTQQWNMYIYGFPTP